MEIHLSIHAPYKHECKWLNKLCPFSFPYTDKSKTCLWLNLLPSLVEIYRESGGVLDLDRPGSSLVWRQAESSFLNEVSFCAEIMWCLVPVEIGSLRKHLWKSEIEPHPVSVGGQRQSPEREEPVGWELDARLRDFILISWVSEKQGQDWTNGILPRLACEMVQNRLGWEVYENEEDYAENYFYT